MAVPNDLYYAKTHEWLKIDEDIATVGITDFAQNQLSDITFVELPDVGREVEAGDEVAVVESVKAASDVFSPVSGTVAEVNAALVKEPERINRDPYGDGWICRLTGCDPNAAHALMSAALYETYLKGL